MVVLLLVALGVLVLLLAGQLWLMILIVRRNENLEEDLKEASHNASIDLQRIQTLKMHLNDAHVSLEAVLKNDSKEVQNMASALEMVLDK